MDTNLTQGLGADAQEMRAAISQAMAEAVRAIPKPRVPSWLEVWIDFVKAHPWISLGVVLVALALISLIIREIICSYLKTNEVLSRLKRIEEKLK